jgi:hypothetical protein
MFSSNSKLMPNTHWNDSRKAPAQCTFPVLFATMIDASARSELTHPLSHHRQQLISRARLENRGERARAIGLHKLLCTPEMP